MRFEVSEPVVTVAQSEQVLGVLETQFRKVASKADRHGDTLTISAVEASFGSINRRDSTIVELKLKENGFLLVASVHYRPSLAFWCILVITLFSYVFWLVPIVFYLVQKKGSERESVS